MAQVKTCSSSTSIPSRRSLVATSRRSALAVVGEEEEGDIVGPQFVDKAVRTGYQVIAAINDPVHVNEIAVQNPPPKKLRIQDACQLLGRRWERRGGLRSNQVRAITLAVDPLRKRYARKRPEAAKAGNLNQSLELNRLIAGIKQSSCGKKATETRTVPDF